MAVPFLVLGLAVWLIFEPSAFSQGIITLETTPYPINLAAADINTWQKEGVRVFVAEGDVWITQGKVIITADGAALLFYEQEALQQKEAKVEVYCEGKVSLVQDKDVQNYEQLFVRLETTAGLVVNPYRARVKTFEEEQPMDLYLKAIKVRDKRKGGEFASREPVEEVTKAPGVVDIVADDIDSWVEGNQRIVSALGNVVIHREDTTLEADNVILWFEQEEADGKKEHVLKELYAEGNVTLRSKEDIRKADKIFQNILEKKGIYINPRIKTEITLRGPTAGPAHVGPMGPTPAGPTPIPIYVGGKEAKQIDGDHMLIKDGYFTTCGFGHPHYRFKSRSVTLTRRTTPTESYSEIVASHDVFYVGDLPVAYVPKYTRDTRTKPSVFKGFGVGSATRFGRVLTTTWDPLGLGIFSGLQRWSNLITRLDFLSRRGPALASEYTYKRPEWNMKGTLETFYVKDSIDRDLQPGGEPVEHSNRGRILWRHRQYMDEYWRADAELSFLSDRGFLREFYEREFKEGKEQETDLYLRRLEDNKSFTFLLKKQINRFNTGPADLSQPQLSGQLISEPTGLEALPQLSYQLISEPIWEDRLNFTSQSELGYLDFHIDDGLATRNPTLFNQLQRTTGNSFRMDNNNILGWPFQLWIWKVKPFVGGRLTTYSKSLENQEPHDGPPVGRLATTLGLDASTQFWRTYSLESKLLRIHKLRHIITPDLRWEAGPTVTEDPDKLLQYTPADGLDTYNAFIFGVRNRLQTRRGLGLLQKTVDLVDLDMELHLLSSPADEAESLVTRTMGNAEGFLIPTKDSFIQPELRSQLTDRIALVSERNEFNLDKRAFDVLSFGMKFQNEPHWSQFVGIRFLRDISTSLILRSYFLLKEKWGATFSEVYSFKSESVTGTTTTQNLGTALGLSRRAHDWTGLLTLNFDVVNRNTSFKFDVIPAGLQPTPGRRSTSF